LFASMAADEPLYFIIGKKKHRLFRGNGTGGVSLVSEEPMKLWLHSCGLVLIISGGQNGRQENREHKNNDPEVRA